MHRLEGGCQVPIGAYATVSDAGGEQPVITLTGLVATPDGKRVFKRTATGVDPLALGREVADVLAAEGAQEVLEQVKRESQA